MLANFKSGRLPIQKKHPKNALINVLVVVGECLEDLFVVTSAEGPSPPVICGENTGEINKPYTEAATGFEPRGR